jgi:hypothetical protein
LGLSFGKLRVPAFVPKTLTPPYFALIQSLLDDDTKKGIIGMYLFPLMEYFPPETREAEWRQLVDSLWHFDSMRDV